MITRIDIDKSDTEISGLQIFDNSLEETVYRKLELNFSEIFTYLFYNNIRHKFANIKLNEFINSVQFNTYVESHEKLIAFM